MGLRLKWDRDGVEERTNPVSFSTTPKHVVILLQDYKIFSILTSPSELTQIQKRFEKYWEGVE